MERELLMKEIVSLNTISQPKSHSNIKDRETHLGRNDILQIQRVLKIELGNSQIHRTGKLKDKDATSKLLDVFIPNGEWRRLNAAEIIKKLRNQIAIVNVSDQVKPSIPVYNLPTSLDPRNMNILPESFEDIVKTIPDVQIDIVMLQLEALDNFSDIVGQDVKINTTFLFKSIEIIAATVSIIPNPYLKGLTTLIAVSAKILDIRNTISNSTSTAERAIKLKDFKIIIRESLVKLKGSLREIKERFISTAINEYQNLDEGGKREYFEILKKIKEVFIGKSKDIRGFTITFIENWINETDSTAPYRTKDEKGWIMIHISHEWKILKAWIHIAAGNNIAAYLKNEGAFDIASLKVRRKFMLFKNDGFGTFDSQTNMSSTGAYEVIYSNIAGNSRGLYNKILNNRLPPTSNITGT